jgi:molybdopterin synthase catalytic subunit
VTAELTPLATLPDDLIPSGGSVGSQSRRRYSWVAVGPSVPSAMEARQWAISPGTGAVVSFAGTVRDHAPGYEQVMGITYQAYEAEVVRRLDEIAGTAQAAWDQVGRIALFHRTGYVALGEESVVVVAAAAHRRTAFEVARFCIDVVKVSAPVWKLEHDRSTSGWSETGVVALSVREAAEAWLAEEGIGR